VDCGLVDTGWWWWMSEGLVVNSFGAGGSLRRKISVYGAVYHQNVTRSEVIC
jgi:hypothetical protein